MQDGALQAVLVTAEATEVRSVTLHIRWQVRTPMCGAILGRSDAHVRCHIRQVRTPMCGAILGRCGRPCVVPALRGQRLASPSWSLS